jgi:PAS domain S-box-containing protein
VSWNAGATTIFGFPAEEAVGKPLAILLSGRQVDEVPRILDALKRGERVEHFEIEGTRKDGAPIDVSLTISPVKNARGAVIAASTIAREFTERKLAEDHKSLLIAELDHRVKNTLSIVTSLVAQTLKSTDSPAAFAESIQGRIMALTRVHQLMTQSNWDQADLRDVVLGELMPYAAENGENIVVSGEEDVVLMQKATLTLAMALHELATNAAKYGALSKRAGRVEVTWSVASGKEAPVLSLAWDETGGPRVEKSGRRGFGTQLIERVMTYELQASVEREFRPEGVRCVIEFPLTAKTGHVRSRDRASP